jgi:ABC-type Mn2+/Zn2+ transport system ATPase subunit
VRVTLEGVVAERGGRQVLDVPVLELAEGRTTAVFGPNGSGKTTLLKAILGLQRPLAGSIDFPGAAGAAPSFGYVPQRERLDPHFPLSALEVAVMGRFGKVGAMRRAGANDYEVAGECLARCRMQRFAERPYRELSGGQQQRVLIARALAGQPDALLLDEPTNGMDLEAERAVMELLQELQREQGTTIVFVTHLLSAIEHFARRVALITRDGSIAAGGKTEMLSPESLARAYSEETE